MAARGLFEFPALLLVLERGGMLTPTLAVQAVRQAALVQRIGDRDRRTVPRACSKARSRSSIGLRMTGVSSAATGTSLLSALMAVPLRDEGFAAGVAAWLVDQVVPVLPPAPTAASTRPWSRRSPSRCRAAIACGGGQ